VLLLLCFCCNAAAVVLLLLCCCCYCRTAAVVFVVVVVVVVVGTGRVMSSLTAEYPITLVLCYSECNSFLFCSLFLVAVPSVPFETWFGRVIY